MPVYRSLKPKGKYGKGYRRYVLAITHYGDVVYNVSKDLSTSVLVPFMFPTEEETYFLMYLQFRRKKKQKELLVEAQDIIEAHRHVDFCDVISYKDNGMFYVARKSYGTIKSFLKAGIIVLEPLYVRNGVKYFDVLARDQRALQRAIQMIQDVSPVPVDIEIFEEDLNITREVMRFLLGDLNILSSLTKSEREALFRAYRMGYFEWPKKANSEVISKSLGISKATFIEHLRKAEKKILDLILGH